VQPKARDWSVSFFAGFLLFLFFMAFLLFYGFFLKALLYTLTDCSGSQQRKTGRQRQARGFQLFSP
jgi:hypothetical protein